MSGPGSGITVPDECITEYKKFQSKASEAKNRRCIIYKIDQDMKNIIIDRIIDREGDDKEDFEKIVSTLEDKEPRYVYIDMKGPPAKEGAQANDRVVGLCWISDSAPVKKRMVYSSSFNSLKAKFLGVYKNISVNDRGDLDYQRIINELK